jgi:hypothetical protein
MRTTFEESFPKKPSRRGVGLALVTVAIGLTIVALTVLPGGATPAVNSTSTVLARGTDQSNGTLALQRGTDGVVAMNTFAPATATTPAGSSGWHSHPVARFPKSRVKPLVARVLASGGLRMRGGPIVLSTCLPGRGCMK